MALISFTYAFVPYNDRTFYFEPDSAAAPEYTDTTACTVPDTIAQDISKEFDTLPGNAPPAPGDTGDGSGPLKAERDIDSTALSSAPADTATPVYDLPAMVVRPPPRRRGEMPYALSNRIISSSEIRQKAGAVEDISRYVSTLPSVVSALGAGYDNTLFIRGGRPDEVVFIVDGIELESINHFSKANGSGGPIGFINSNNVKSLDFYSGTMPVAFPSRLSSVLDIDMKNGSLYESRQSLGVKLTGGMVSAEGPITNGKSSYALSGRYVDFSALRTYVKDAGLPKVADFFGKIFIVASDALDLSATGVLSWNHYRFFYPSIEIGYDGTLHGNEKNEIERILQGGGGMKLRYVQGSAVHEARLAASFRNGSKADSLSSLDDPFFADRYAANPFWIKKDKRIRYQMNTSSTFSLSERQKLSLGVRAGVNRYGFSERNDSNYAGNCVICKETGPDTVFIREVPKQKSVSFYGMEPGLFLEYAAVFRLLRFTAGMRADYFDLLRDAAFSPRLSLAITPRAIGSFSAAGGLYHQFPTEVPSFAFAVLPFGAPADSLAELERAFLRQSDPQRCWQASLGYNRFIRHDHEVRIETYYKWYDREYGFVVADTQQFFENDRSGTIKMRDQHGKRRAVGIEGSLGNHESQRFFYSLSGSLFDIKNRYDDGSWQHDWTDVGYTFALSCGARLFGSHSISLSVQGSGGRPYCPKIIVDDCVKRKIAVFDADIPYFSQRLEKLVYASMRYSFLHQGGKLRTEGFLEVLNVLDYTPTLEYKWSGNRFVEVKPFNITPILGATVYW
jgi:hypothetical protein